MNQAVGAVGHVVQAIKDASKQAGVDFSYMLTKATQESGLNPTAKASSSSATGLFQFIDQTWLRTVKTYGEKYGLGEMASRITIDSDGVAHVADKAERSQILNLRKDPEVSAQMAAELTNENKESLQQNVGGKIGSTELYLAHFLGAGGASNFLNEMHGNPSASAAAVLPEAASANPSVFYDKAGQPRTLAQIYKHFAAKFDKANSAATTAVASADISKAKPALYNISQSLNVASIASDSANAAYAPSMLSKVSVGADSNSAFAAMIFAQMDMGNFGSPLTSHGLYKSEEERKRDGSFGLIA